MVFLRPVVVRSKEQNNSISLDRYEYMRALGTTTRPQDDTILMRNLGAYELPPLTNGQPPAGGTMATLPPPAPPTARPGAATGPGTNPPASTQPNQAPVPEFRPVTPPNQK
jgi:general secretion pathway protein D